MFASLAELAEKLSTQAAGLSVAALGRLLHADMRARWSVGQCLRVEDYQEHFPALAGDVRALLDLIDTEFLLREQNGPEPTVDEYAARFPEVAEDVRRQLEIHQLLRPQSQAKRAATPGDLLTVSPGAAVSDAATLPPESDPEATGNFQQTPTAQLSVLVPGYEILSELGRGGMGVVYKARHLQLNRIVALKMVLTGGHAGSEERLRFLAEAKAVAALQHPNIVQVFDFGQTGELPYMAMEYVNGGSLHDRLRDRCLFPVEAAWLVEQVSCGIQAAHTKGIVHRDLKPHNVLLTAPPDSESKPAALIHCTPKVTDFGLAKRVEGGSGLTQTGAVMGTPSYMAPEQAEGRKDIGPAADVYALGAILYECLTGRPPFRGTTPMETIMKVVADPPIPVRQLQPKCPCDLETICHKCLHKDPLRRYGSAEALAKDLRRFQAGKPIAARPVGRLERAVMWARRNPSWAFHAAFLLALFPLLALALGQYSFLSKSTFAYFAMGCYTFAGTVFFVFFDGPEGKRWMRALFMFCVLLVSMWTKVNYPEVIMILDPLDIHHGDIPYGFILGLWVSLDYGLCFALFFGGLGMLGCWLTRGIPLFSILGAILGGVILGGIIEGLTGFMANVPHIQIDSTIRLKPLPVFTALRASMLFIRLKPLLFLLFVLYTFIGALLGGYLSRLLLLKPRAC
jgi:tRNA A-37 threonylcarbamoyl transferase component Bud32